MMMMMMIMIRMDAPLHREYPHQLIFIINRAIRNVTQAKKRRVSVKFQEFEG